MKLTKITVDEELGRMCKTAVVAYFKVKIS